MPRPRHYRTIAQLPQVSYYKPRGVPLAILQCVRLAIDELEAIRLADLNGLYHEQAAEKMNISRQTFGRILESAHKKIADALVNGKALSIEGGRFEVPPVGGFPGPRRRFRGGRGGPGRGRPGRGPAG